MTHRLFLAALLLFVAGDCAAQAIGRVLSAAGDVVAVRTGREEVLTAGSALFNGDVIRTGEESSAQLRFTDEGVVAMRSKSRFAVSDYRFTGSDDGVSTAAYRLLQGGIRTLTGLIGKTRRERYIMGTPLATVGIRGTAFTLVLCQRDCFDTDGSIAPDGTYGVVFDGRVAVTNDAGVVEFGADEAFFVSDIRTLAQPLLSRPGFLRDRLEARARREQRREQMEARTQQQQQQQQQEQQQQVRNAGAMRPGDRPPLPPAFADGRTTAVGNPLAPIIVVGDLRDSSGNIALVGVGLGAGVGFAGTAEPAAIVDGGLGTVIELDGSRGFLERFVFNGGAQTGSRQNALVVDNGKQEGDGGATWGRWAPGATVQVAGQTGVPTTGVHFFFGNLTPEPIFANVPSGATAVRYEYVGGPRPTNERGTPGQFLSGDLLVNFVQRAVSGELIYRIDTYTYKLPVPDNTPITLGRGFAGFNVNQSNAGNWASSSNGAFGTLDRYSVSGLFLGSRAQGVGVTFATVDATAGRTAGAAVFRCVSGVCR